MTLTPTQLEARQKGIGSSDIACLLCPNDYRSGFDLWREKTGRAEPFEGNRATELGNALEAAVLDVVASDINQPICRSPNTFTYDAGTVQLRANVDGMVGKRAKRGLPIVEAKTGFQGGPDEWDDPEKNPEGIANAVMVQVQHQMLCAGSEVAYVGRLRGDYRQRIAVDVYRVEAHADLQNLIIDRARAFWHYVETDEPYPDIRDTRGTSAFLDAIEAEAGKTVTVDAELVALLHDAIEARKEAERVEKDLRARFRVEVGDASAVECDGWKVGWSWVKGRATLDTKAIERDHPEIAEQYRKLGAPYPRLTIKAEGVRV